MALNVGPLKLEQPSIEPFSVPVRIQVAQSIVTDQGSERVRFTYSFNPDNDIFFDSTSGPVKRVTRSETVTGPVPSRICHRFNLVRGQGDQKKIYTLTQITRDEADRRKTKGQELAIA